MLSSKPRRLESFARVFLGSNWALPARPTRSEILRSPQSSFKRLVTGGIALFSLSPAQACCGFDEIGAPGFTGQTSLIFWDSEKKTQHFVRRADFSTKSTVAFLVATPTVPKFSTVDPEIWSIVERANTPPKGGLVGMGCSAPGDMAPAAAAMDSKGVTVLHEEKLDGNQIVVLTATSAKAVSDYLMARKFKVFQEAIPWFEKYLKQGWVFTAIKSLPGAGEESTRTTGEVLLSFKTDRPFHPYFVPKANRAPDDGRGLKAFYISDEAFPKHADLPGTDEDTFRVSPVNRTALADGLNIPATQLPTRLVTMVYRDSQFPRVGPTPANPSAAPAWEDDLFFPAPTDEDKRWIMPSVEDQAVDQKRFATIVTWTPMVLLAGILFLIGRGVLRIFGRRKRAV